MNESKPKRKRGRPVAEEIRKRIGELHAAGHSQIEIATMLGMSESGVRRHIRGLGIEPRPLRAAFKGHKVISGVKRCAICGEDKPVTEFRHPRHATCAACRREQGLDDS